MAYRPAPRVVPGVAALVGDELHVPDQAMLPEICLKCGARSELRTGPREIVWVPRILVATWFLNPLLGALAVALLQKRAEIVCSLCPACGLDRREAITASRAIFAAAFVTFAASAALIGTRHPVLGVGVVFLGGSLGYLAHARWVLRRGFDVAWIHRDGTIALRNIPESVRAACAPFVGASPSLPEPRGRS